MPLYATGISGAADDVLDVAGSTAGILASSVLASAAFTMPLSDQISARPSMYGSAVG